MSHYLCRVTDGITITFFDASPRDVVLPLLVTAVFSRPFVTHQRSFVSRFILFKGFICFFLPVKTFFNADIAHTAPHFLAINLRSPVGQPSSLLAVNLTFPLTRLSTSARPGGQPQEETRNERREMRCGVKGTPHLLNVGNSPTYYCCVTRQRIPNTESLVIYTVTL